MNFYEEVIYEQSKFEEALTRIVFDPEIIPIHSCLRPEDDLQSCYGPVQKKSVGFSDYITIYNYSAEETYVDMSGYKNLPHPRRKETYRLFPANFAARGLQKWRQSLPPHFDASQLWGYENLFMDPYSVWGLASEEIQFNLNPMPSILKRDGAASREKKLVRFALMQEEVSVNGDKTQTFVVFDPLPNCWKANIRFDCGPYWLNCSMM